MFRSPIFRGTGLFRRGAGGAVFEAFTENGEWLVPFGVTKVNVLLIAGGGGGAADMGSGGGAGQARLFEDVAVVPGDIIDITVGAAGSAGVQSAPDNGRRGGTGGNSVFGPAQQPGEPDLTLTAIGGGGGASRDSTDKTGGDGGSGGGGATGTATEHPGGEAVDPLYGSDGAAGAPDPGPYHGGGGGGFSNTAERPHGGAGVNFPHLIPAAYGDGGYFCGGGGGGGTQETAGALLGEGGIGGGGNGGITGSRAGKAAQEATGGGGGGAHDQASGGAGGSGVVFITTSVILPATPLATAATGIGGGSFKANWEAANGAATYQLDVASDAAFTTFVTGYENLDVGAGTSHVVTGLDPETQYWYRLRAVNEAGTSDSSNVIDVTTGAFAPDNITDLGLWIDFSDADTLFDATIGGSTPGADGQIARVEDKSGNGRHFTQATSANRPIRKVEEQNSEDVARFDGTNDFMDLSAGLDLLRNVPGTTAFVVARTNGGSSVQRTFWVNTEAEGNFSLVSNGRMDTDAVRLQGHRVQTDDQFIVTDGSWGAVATAVTSLVDYQSGRAELFKDGVSIGSDEALSSAGNSEDLNHDSVIVGATPNITQFWDGDICEILIYRRVLTASEREQVEPYLQSKWATPALP